MATFWATFGKNWLFCSDMWSQCYPGTCLVQTTTSCLLWHFDATNAFTIFNMCVVLLLQYVLAYSFLIDSFY